MTAGPEAHIVADLLNQAIRRFISGGNRAFEREGRYKMASGKTVSRENAGERRQVALLFELETLALDGRVMLFDICRKHVADRDIEFSEALFARFCASQCDEKHMAALLDFTGKKRVSAAKLSEDIKTAWKVALARDGNKLNPHLGKLIDGLRAKGVAIGALSGMDKDSADALAGRLKLDERQVTVLAMAREDRSFPTADAWLKLAKAVSVSALGCTALVSSAISAKAALSAGMHCVAIPDEFTAYQDFGGVDFVFDKLTDGACQEIAAAVMLDR